MPGRLRKILQDHGHSGYPPTSGTEDYTPRVRLLLRAVCFLLAAGSLVSPPTVSAAAKKESLRRWLDGPVHYLADPSEIKEFKSQKTEQDRAAFVERFWRRRDPTPTTLVNEYRQLFWNRVREANEKFLDSAGPGWQTDRGKIYILYGPPDEVKEDPNANAGSDIADTTGLIRWVYLKPGGRRDVDPVVYVPFVRSVSGEYRLSYDPKLSSPFFTWSQVEDNRTKGLGDFLTSIQPGGTALGAMLDLGKLQEVPPQEIILLDSIETIETYAYEPLPLAIDRFQPGGSGLLAVVTVSIPGPSGVEPPSIIARFTQKGLKTEAKVLGEGSFRIENEGDERIAQGRVSLEAVPWEVTVLSVEPGTGISRIFRGRVDPLPSGPALRLSDVVPARALEPLPFASQASYDAPYIVGGFRVTPRAGSPFRRGGPVRIFYEIYGGTAPYHLAYQLEGQEKDGRWRALGAPQESDGTERGQGFALETAASWPAGAYRLRVRVRDAAAASAEGVAAWSLVADPTR
jgi:GWxTD domain-containing protein